MKSAGNLVPAAVVSLSQMMIHLVADVGDMKSC